MSTKKLMVATLSVAIVLSLTACGTDSKTSSKQGGYSGIIQSVPTDSSNSEQNTQPESNEDFEIRDDVLVKYKGSAAEVTIPDGVIDIGDEAFGGCTSLTSVTIPNSVTSICNGAFWNCTGLTSITIPDGVTDIGNSAFDGCTSLTSVTIPNKLTDIRAYIFYGCTSLTSIKISDRATCIGYCAFGKCTSLTNITIPDSVTDIGELAFSGCEGIKATYKGKTYDYAHIDELYKAINGN